MLEYCKKSISAVNSYYEHLLPEYRDEVGLLFLTYIKKRAQEVSNRNGYREVCDIIRSYVKACGKEAYVVREELMGRHVRQPAFLDELRKVR